MRTVTVYLSTMTYLRSSLALGLALLAGVGLAQGCGSSGGSSTFHGDGGHGGDSTTVGGDGGLGDGPIIPLGDGSVNSSGLVVTPTTLQTITVTAGMTTPAVVFTATNNGAPAAVGWGIDKGNIGTIAAGPTVAGTFVPTGTTGGIVNIVASLGSMSVTRQVLVQLT